jgi:PPOX class probable F420-dependent enzyme
MSGTTFETLAASRYVSLTTFRGDGTPVATPVWVARDGDVLLVVTGATSGKVRRIRANPSVTLAPCDVRGRVHGDAIAGQAVVLDASETARVTRKIRRRYGLIGWLFSRGSDSGRIGVSITLG